MGTQQLPEAQTDRFMISMSIGYPDYESEFLMAKGIRPEEKYSRISPVLNREDFLAIQKKIYQVYMKDTVYGYIKTDPGYTGASGYRKRRKPEGYDRTGKDGESMGMDKPQRLCDAVRCKLSVSLCCGTQDYFIKRSGDGRKEKDRSTERNIE